MVFFWDLKGKMFIVPQEKGVLTEEVEGGGLAGDWVGHLCIHRDREREAKMQWKTLRAGWD